MKVAIVNPIAATPDITLNSLIHPRVSSRLEDFQTLRETNIVELGAALAREGHPTTVFLGDVYLANGGQDLGGGLRVQPIPTTLHVPFHPGLFPMVPRLMDDSRLREHDVVQSGEFHQPASFFAAVAADRAEIPLVVWQETFRPMRFPGSLYQVGFEGLVGGYLANRVDTAIPRTSHAVDFLVSLGIPPDRVGPWIPTGIDVDTFVPLQSHYGPEDLGWGEDALLLLTVARLHPAKGVDRAIRALRILLREVPDARLVVRGGGPELIPLRLLAQQLKVEDQVRFVGRMSRQELIHLYNAASLLWCPSRADLLPFSLMEASACGLPAVATDVGAVHDIVLDGKTGIVIENPAPQALADATASLLREDGARTAMARNARRRMEDHFALGRVAERLAEVYRGLER